MEKITIKGIQQTFRTLNVFTFENLLELLNEADFFLTAKQITFKYLRKTGNGITIEPLDKVFKPTCDKGLVDLNTYDVLPFGWDDI